MFLIDVLLQLKKKIGKTMCVLLFQVCNGLASSIKEAHSLIWNVNHLLLRKTEEVLKTSIFSERKFEEMH